MLQMTDEQLKRAVKMACEEEIKDMEESVNSKGLHKFSQHFCRRMKELMNTHFKYEKSERLQTGKRKHLKLRYALITVLLLVLCTSSVVAVEPIREKMKDLIYTVFLNYIEIENEETSVDADGEIIWKEPTEIPEGYEKAQEEKDDLLGQCFITWTNEEGNVLTYIQGDADSVTLALSSDGEKPEEITIDGKKAQYAIDENGSASLFFEDGNIIYAIQGRAEKEELIKMAESIQ